VSLEHEDVGVNNFAPGREGDASPLVPGTVFGLSVDRYRPLPSML